MNNRTLKQAEQKALPYAAVFSCGEKKGDAPWTSCFSEHLRGRPCACRPACKPNSFAVFSTPVAAIAALSYDCAKIHYIGLVVRPSVLRVESQSRMLAIRRRRTSACQSSMSASGKKPKPMPMAAGCHLNLAVHLQKNNGSPADRGDADNFTGLHLNGEMLVPAILPWGRPGPACCRHPCRRMTLG